MIFFKSWNKINDSVATNILPGYSATRTQGFSLSLSLTIFLYVYHQATLGLTTLSHSVEHALIIVFSIIYTPPSTME